MQALKILTISTCPLKISIEVLYGCHNPGSFWVIPRDLTSHMRFTKACVVKHYSITSLLTLIESKPVFISIANYYSF